MKKRESKLKFSADEMSVVVDSAADNGSKRTDDNAGKDSADAVVDVTDRGIRATESAYRSYSQTRRTQSSSQRISNRQTQRAPSGHSSSTGSKLQQKRAIKKDYAAAKSGKGTARTVKNTQRTIKTARKKAKQAERGAVFIIRNRKAIIVLGLLAVMMLFLFGVFSSCSVLFQGGTAAFSGTTYPASDEDILGAEELYCNMELGLQSRIDYYASNTNYDEYHYNIGEIGHSPHLLISAISALHPEGWDLESASGTISSLFDSQYVLTEEVKTETRYRTEVRTAYLVYTDPYTGEQTIFAYDYEEQVPYEYTICTVTLEVTDIFVLAGDMMDFDEYQMFLQYYTAQGNRPDLFADVT